MKKIIISALAFNCLLSTSFAGDMGPVYVAPNFGGLYIGAGAGFTTLYTSDQLSSTRAVNPTLDELHYSDTASLFTGAIGYGAMLSPNAYLGAKASIYYTPLRHTAQSSADVPTGDGLILVDSRINRSLKPIYNLDAVLGYAVTPTVMPFIEGGVSFAHVKTNYDLKRTVVPADITESERYSAIVDLDDNKTGYNVGLGINYLPHSNWIISTEIVYNDLGKNSGSAVVIPGTDTQTRTVLSQAVSMFASVSYLFPNL